MTLSTTNMKVTSIRLDPFIVNKLKEMSGDMGYQKLIREILNQYVASSGFLTMQIKRGDIVAVIDSFSTQPGLCSLTGAAINREEITQMAVAKDGLLHQITYGACDEDHSHPLSDTEYQLLLAKTDVSNLDLEGSPPSLSGEYNGEDNDLALVDVVDESFTIDSSGDVKDESYTIYTSALG